MIKAKTILLVVLISDVVLSPFLRSVIDQLICAQALEVTLVTQKASDLR